MTWHARLQLDYTVEAERCVLRHQHTGPLRILQSLYPEGDAVCHNVLVHPPGGLVGGDTLDITATVGPGAHGLLTTPGAKTSTSRPTVSITGARMNAAWNFSDSPATSRSASKESTCRPYPLRRTVISIAPNDH